VRGLAFAGLSRQSTLRARNLAPLDWMHGSITAIWSERARNPSSALVLLHASSRPHLNLRHCDVRDLAR
jgi:hypothetical protein